MLNEEVGVGFRNAPRMRDWWRWYEVHMMVFIFLVAICIVIFVETQIIPQILVATQKLFVTSDPPPPQSLPTVNESKRETLSLIDTP